MANDSLAVQARGALDPMRMECVEDIRFIDKENVERSSGQFAVRFRDTVSTPGLALHGFIGGSWTKVPGQSLDVVAREFRAPLTQPAFYALLRPRRGGGPPLASPLHPSAAEAEAAVRVEPALTPLAPALTELLAPRPHRLTPDQTREVETLLKKQSYAPVTLLNRYGVAVWHRDSGAVGSVLQDGPDGRIVLTRAFELAYRWRRTAACRVSPVAFEIAFPLLTDGVVGALVVQS